MTARNEIILLAEDDENDILLLRWAFKEAGLADRLICVHDGQEAIDYLSGTGPYRDRERHPEPGLLLLDLNMPRVNGFEVLAWRNQQEQWLDLPCIVLSSSNRECDVKRAMDLGAESYIAKPSDFRYLVEVAHKLREQWFGGGKGSEPGLHGLAMQRLREV